MTGTNGSSNEDIQAMLVFLANGTLTGGEGRRVEQAVEASPELQADLAALKAARQQMQAEEPVRSPGELGLARLMRDVSAAPETAYPRRSTSRLWKAAAIAAMALLAVQSTVQFLDTGPVAELADGGPETRHEGPVLTVAFAAAATEQEIRSLLLELNLSIISGPSALGLYSLAAADEAAAEEALERLRGAAGLVESAEAGTED